MKAIIKFLIEELIIDPLSGIKNIYLIITRKQKPPEWLTSKWDIKQQLKDGWIIYLMLILGISIGWLLSAKYYQLQAYNTAPQIACELIQRGYGKGMECLEHGMTILNNITPIHIPIK